MHYPVNQAVALASRALALLDQLPETPRRAQQELQLQMVLGTQLQIIRGRAAPEVEQACTRARELCQRVGEAPDLAVVVWGLWSFHFGRAQGRTARELAEQLLAMARGASDPAPVLPAAHHAMALSLLFSGELDGADEHFEQVIALTDSQAAFYESWLGWLDPRVVCLV